MFPVVVPVISPEAGGVRLAARREEPAAGTDPLRTVAVGAEIVLLALRTLGESRHAAVDGLLGSGRHPDRLVARRPIGRITMPYHNYAPVGRVSASTHVFLAGGAIDPTRTVASITLPPAGANRA